MGRKPSIDETTGARLLEAYQRLGSKAAAAAEVGVHESAARRYLDGTAEAAAPVIATQREVLRTAGASLWDMRSALDESYQRILRLVEQLEAGIMVISLDDDGERYETMVSPAILVQAIRESREHMETAIKFSQTLIAIDETRRFQQAVLEAIGDVDDATKQRILAKLQERRALELAL